MADPKPPTDLRAHYADYIAHLNTRPIPSLARFVAAENVTHNTTPMTLSDYEQLIKDSVVSFPELKYEVEMVVVDQELETVAARIRFAWLKGGEWDREGLEHVLYQFRQGKIVRVWSLVVGMER